MSEIGVLLLVKHLRNKLKRTDQPNSVRIMFLRIRYATYWFCTLKYTNNRQAEMEGRLPSHDAVTGSFLSDQELIS
jgi:hypothetical protein